MRKSCIIVACVAPFLLEADTLKLVQSGDAAVAENWNPAHAPTAGDVAIVGGGQKLAVTSDLSADSLWTDNGMNDAGIVDQSAGAVSLSGTSGDDGSAALRLGNDGGACGRYRQTGGTLSVPTGKLSVGRWGMGVLSMMGSQTIATFGCDYPSIGGWNNGSTVADGMIAVRGGATAKFVGTSGILCVGERGHGRLAVTDGAKLVSAKEMRLGVQSDGSGSRGYLCVGSGGGVEVPVLQTGYGVGSVYVAGGALAVRPTQAYLKSRGFLGSSVSATETVSAQVAGATFDVASNKCVTCAAPLAAARLTRANLAHRWRFNGSLDDEVGGKTAALAGSNAASITLGDRQIALPGGVHGTAYVKLGMGVIPTSDAGVTIELWATPTTFSKNYDRIFSANLDWIDAESYKLLSPCWTTSNFPSDFVKMRWNSDTDQHVWSVFTAETYDVSYAEGREVHLVIVIKKIDDAWHAIFYRDDPERCSLLRSKDITINNANWTPAQFADMLINLGYSFENNPDACAAYNEFRTWKIALSEDEIRESSMLGPDADFTSSGITKTGEGVLALSAGNSYEGATTVSNGTLALAPIVVPTACWRIENDACLTLQGEKNLRFQGDDASQISCADGWASLPGAAHEKAFLQVDNVFGNYVEDNGVTLEFCARLDEMRNWRRLFTLFTDGVQTGVQVTWGADSTSWDLCQWRRYGEDDTVYSGLCDDTHQWQVGKAYHVSVVVRKADSGITMTIARRDVQTGEVIKSLSRNAAWTAEQVRSLTLRLGWAWDPTEDAKGSFGEVRIWPQALSDADLKAVARTCAPQLPLVATSVPDGDVLPSGTDLALGENSALTLAGVSQHVASFTGSGSLVGPGTLTVSGLVNPVRRLTLADGIKLVGTIALDVRKDGSGDRLVFESGATYDLSGMRLQLTEGSDTSGYTRCRIADAEGAILTGSPDVSLLPKGASVIARNGGLYLRIPSGMAVLLR